MEQFKEMLKVLEYQKLINEKFKLVKECGGIQILSLPRLVGKTHKTIEILKKYIDEVAVIVPLRSYIQRFPIHLRKSVFTFAQANDARFEYQLRDYSIFIIDEGFGVATPELIKLYYTLGSRLKSVLVIGTKL